MAALPLEIDNQCTLSLESQMQRLALEANFVTNVLATFKNVLPSLITSLNNSFRSLISDKSNYQDYVKDLDSSIKSKLKLASYSNYSRTLVSVPEGFKGNFLKYTNTLSSISPGIHKEANLILGEYSFVLSSFLTNKESKTALKDHTDLFQRVTKRREEMSKLISTYFKNNESTSKQYLKDVIDRFADVEVLVKEMQQLNKLQKSSSLVEISNSVDKTVKLLDMVYRQLQEDGIDKVSGNAAMNIAEGAYSLGKYIEFVSIYYYRVQQMNVSTNKLVEKLDSIL